MLIRIGTTELYAQTTLEDALDGFALSESMPESLTLTEIFPTSATIWLNDPGVNDQGLKHPGFLELLSGTT